MSAKIPSIALVLASLAPPLAAETITLASYSFDDELIDTGPDTFQVFEFAKGRVALNTDFPYSGYRSVQIQDVSKDGSFPELQGYFPIRKTGRLHFHFAFMVADPGQELNIALAGPAHFNLKRDGIGFWLLLENGRLSHMSDGLPRPLFDPQPFVWYVVDLDYAIEQGRYGLRIANNAWTMVDIGDAPNAVGLPGSVVDKFSFVGDLWKDVSNVSYFIDDIGVAASDGAAPGPWAAPGRRKLFIDHWREQQQRLQAKPGCFPVSSLPDFGIAQAGLDPVDAGTRKAFWRVVSGQPVQSALPPPLDGWAAGITAWYAGCQALAGNQPGPALEAFDKAGAFLPGAPLLEYSRIQALAALKRWDAVDAALAAASGLWGEDVRFAVLAGRIGFMRGGDAVPGDGLWAEGAKAVPESDFLAWAGAYFGTPVDRKRLDPAAADPGRNPQLQRYVLAEQYFFSLLWRGQYGDAQAYARRMAEHFADLAKARALWLERGGDAAFLAGWRAEADAAYRAATGLAGKHTGAWLKLSDLAYLAGDSGEERRYREAVYGSLRE